MANIWGNTSLKTALNSSYLTNLGATWSNKIAFKDWYVGGIEGSSPTGMPANSLYKKEDAAKY